MQQTPGTATADLEAPFKPTVKANRANSISGNSRWRTMTPWFFMLPAMVMFSVYVIAPIFQSIWISFFDWDGIGEKTFIGLGNYVELMQDPQFWTSLWNNVLWLVFFMLAVPIGLGVALFLNQQCWAFAPLSHCFSFLSSSPRSSSESCFPGSMTPVWACCKALSDSSAWIRFLSWPMKAW